MTDMIYVQNNADDKYTAVGSGEKLTMQQMIEEKKYHFVVFLTKRWLVNKNKLNGVMRWV